MARAPGAPVRASDKVAQVLARDEALVEVFVRHSPRFAKLRHAALRRTMARLVTVAQAAEIADVPLAPLLADLNRALGLGELPAAEPPGRAGAEPLPDDPAPMPPPPGAPEVELDVRESLRRGEEPFTRITEAVNALRDGEVLCLRVPFRPVPLIRLLARRGFAHDATRLGADDWIVRFFRSAAAVPAAPARGHPDTPAPHDARPAIRGGEVWLDVTGLEPPEPLVRTLAALEDLAPGETLVQVNVRVPQHLLPVLQERGFSDELDQTTPGRVLTRIRRAGS